VNFPNIERLHAARIAAKLTIEEREKFDSLLLGYIVCDVDPKLLNQGIAAAEEEIRQDRERKR